MYLARVTGNPSNDALSRLRRGVYMDGDERRTYPAQVRVVRDESLFSDILVTIHEGRNRQVRRMFDAIGHKVLLCAASGSARWIWVTLNAVSGVN